MRDKKIKNIAIYGSCISRDPFTTRFNKDYKKKYKIAISDQGHSFISTMQEKEEVVNESELKVFPENKTNLYRSRRIKEDLQKTFLDLMLLNDIDYLIFDIHYEVLLGVISYDDGKFLSNPPYLSKTEFYSKLTNIKRINIYENTNQFFELWMECCDKFFNFLEKNCPKTKVILVEARAIDIVQRQNLSTYVEPSYTLSSKLINFYHKKLEDYIKKKFDVLVINFYSDAVLNENHVWGKYFLHYTDDYYTNFLKNVDEIVEYDELKKQVEFLYNENESLSNEVHILKNQLMNLNK